MLHKSAVVKHGLSRSNRHKAGLGDPPSTFTTNASESINALLENKMDYKKHELPVFLDKLKEVIEEQERELERAVVDSGKYQFCANYQHLVKQQSVWFMKMSTSQRENHLKKVARANLKVDSASKQPNSGPLHTAVPHSECQNLYSLSNLQGNPVPICSRTLMTTDDHPSFVSSSVVDVRTEKPTCSRRLFSSSASQSTSSSCQPQSVTIAPTENNLSVSIDDFSESVITPIEILKAIWNKASELLRDPNSISFAPGQDSSARVVRSYSGPRPHLVTRKRNGQYACDNVCPNWRSLGICAHSVAAAEDNSEQPLFVCWYSKAKNVPNVTKLTTTQMPAGRKGSRAPPRKPKVQTNSRVPFSAVSGMQESGRDRCSGTSHESLLTTALSQPSPSGQRGESAIINMSIENAEIVDTHLSPSNVIMNIHTPDVTYHNLPIAPPPLIRCASESPDSSPFTLTFVVGNIRICRGCRQKYPKPAKV